MNRTSASRFGGEKTTTILSVCRKLVDRRRVELRLDACKATVFPSYSQPISRYSHAGHTVMRVSQILVTCRGFEPRLKDSESFVLPVKRAGNRRWRGVNESNALTLTRSTGFKPVRNHFQLRPVELLFGLYRTDPFCSWVENHSNVGYAAKNFQLVRTSRGTHTMQFLWDQLFFLEDLIFPVEWCEAYCIANEKKQCCPNSKTIQRSGLPMALCVLY